MRWPWSRDPAPASDTGGHGTLDLDAIDLERLEVIELDADGRPTGDPPPRASVAEAPYGPARDGTGLAGVWEALGAEG